MTTITLPVKIWCTNKSDLPRLFQESDRPYLYADASLLDMTPYDWTLLQETTLSFELDEALRPAPILPPVPDLDTLAAVDLAVDEGALDPLPADTIAVNPVEGGDNA